LQCNCEHLSAAAAFKRLGERSCLPLHGNGEHDEILVLASGVLDDLLRGNVAGHATQHIAFAPSRPSASTGSFEHDVEGLVETRFVHALPDDFREAVGVSPPHGRKQAQLELLHHRRYQDILDRGILTDDIRAERTHESRNQLLRHLTLHSQDLAKLIAGAGKELVKGPWRKDLLHVREAAVIELADGTHPDGIVIR
jgi:hypothetical protein